MPFKDIDWGKVAKQTEVSYNIGRANAFINAKSDKNIQKVELLSGIDLLQRDPLEEAIQMEKIVREQQPIISKLKEISEKTITPQALTTIMQNLPAVDYDGTTDQEPLAIASTSTTKARHRRSTSDPLFLKVHKGIDENILKKYNYKMPYEIANEIASDKTKLLDLQKLQKEVAKKSSSLGPKSSRNPDLISEKETFKAYNKKLKQIMEEHDSIEKATSTSTSTGKGVKNKIYYTNVKELLQRLSVLVGEFEAGNKSKRIKNEIADISHHLYRKKALKKKEYRTIYRM